MLKKIDKERGAVAVVIAIFMTVLLGFSAVAIDTGRIALEKQSLQNALDAASLAAAQDLPNNTATAEATAKEYVADNGYSAADIYSIVFSNSNKRIKISAKKPVEYTFARVFNNADSTTVDVSAAAEISNIFDPYDYALFSGSEINLLQFTGKNYVTGDVHSNNSIKNDATVIGTITAVGNIDSKVDATGGKEKVAYIPMPDLSDVMEIATTLTQAELEGFGATYKSGVYSMSSEQFNACVGNRFVLIDGSLKINGSGVMATGTIIATGDITFDGGGLGFSGLLYAPNGTITINGNSGTIRGSIIANVIDSNGGLDVIYDSNALDDIPLTLVRLVE